jgi:hypothetical protein
MMYACRNQLSRAMLVLYIQLHSTLLRSRLLRYLSALLVLPLEAFDGVVARESVQERFSISIWIGSKIKSQDGEKQRF